MKATTRDESIFRVGFWQSDDNCNAIYCIWERDIHRDFVCQKLINPCNSHNYSSWAIQMCSNCSLRSGTKDFRAFVGKTWHCSRWRSVELVSKIRAPTKMSIIELTIFHILFAPSVQAWCFPCSRSRTSLRRTRRSAKQWESHLSNSYATVHHISRFYVSTLTFCAVQRRHNMTTIRPKLLLTLNAVLAFASMMLGWRSHFFVDSTNSRLPSES